MKFIKLTAPKSNLQIYHTQACYLQMRQVCLKYGHFLRNDLQNRCQSN